MAGEDFFFALPVLAAAHTLCYRGRNMPRVLVYGTVLLSLCFTAPGPVGAQEAAEAEEAAEDVADDLEVLVTASRVEEEASEAAASVTVLTAEELKAAGNLTLADALENVAGLQFRSYSGNAAQAVASMRGFSENSHGRVLVLLDGHRLNMPDMRAPNWLQIPLDRVERVEIVRGGNTALYGDNALGGVINIITRQAKEGLEIQVSGSGGSFGTQQEALSIRGGGDALTYSAGAQYTSSDGYRERSGYRSLGLAAGLGFDLGQRLSNSLSLSYDQLYYQMPGYLDEAQLKADPTQAVNPDDETDEQYLNAGWKLALQMPAALLETELFYSWKFFETDMTSWFSFTDRTYQNLGFSPRIGGEVPLGGRPSRLLAGADLSLDLLAYESYSSAARTTLDRAADLSRANLGVYVSDDLELRKDLTVSGGFRYEAARIAITGTEAVTLEEALFHQVLAASGSLLYHVEEGHKAYIRYERVYRLPFLDEQISYQGFGADTFLGDLEPEKGHNVELGSEVAVSSAFKAAVNIYLLAMTDEIAWNDAASRNENLDKTWHYGGEAELSVRLGKIARLTGNYTYTRAFYREGPNEGKELALVPNHSAAGEASLALLPGLTAGAAVSYVGEMYKDGDTTNERQPLAGYTVCGLSLGFKQAVAAGSLEISAGVENLFDQSYSSTAGYDSFFVQDYYYPAPGRSWNIGGSYQY